MGRRNTGVKSLSWRPTWRYLLRTEDDPGRALGRGALGRVPIRLDGLTARSWRSKIDSKERGGGHDGREDSAGYRRVLVRGYQV